MSFRLKVLNVWLRQVERRRMARACDAPALRKLLEGQAKLFFHAPRGVSRSWIKLGDDIDALALGPRGANADRIILYIHGGGFVFGSPNTHAAMVAQLAQRVGARAILPRYRLAPEAPFPAAIDDVEAAWDALMAQGVDPKNIVLGGDSAGGALAFSLLGQLCAKGRPTPAGVFGFSPLADLSYSSASFRENAAREVVLPAERASEMRDMYLKGHDCTDPRVSPVHAHFKDAPPVWLTVGDTEILRDDAHALGAKLQEGGAVAELHETQGRPHVWPLLHALLPEARETLDDVAGWIRRLPEWQDES